VAGAAHLSVSCAVPSAFYVLSRSAWIEPGALRHFGIGAEPAMEHGAVAREKLGGGQLSGAQLVE
jgi:hypothetical protein